MSCSLGKTPSQKASFLGSGTRRYFRLPVCHVVPALWWKDRLHSTLRCPAWSGIGSTRWHWLQTCVRWHSLQATCTKPDESRVILHTVISTLSPAAPAIPLLKCQSDKRLYGRRFRKNQLGLQSLYNGSATPSDQFRQASQPASQCASSNGKQMDSPPTTVTARESLHLPYP